MRDERASRPLTKIVAVMERSGHLLHVTAELTVPALVAERTTTRWDQTLGGRRPSEVGDAAERAP